MVQIADKPVGCSRAESQRVAPEVPLEDDDGERHHGNPDQRQGGFSSGETRVKEGDTGHHNQDHARSHNDEGLVTGLVPLVQVCGGCGLEVVS